MSIKANIHDAKTNLSRLIEKALAGEDVVIAKAGKPLVKLVPVVEAKPFGQWLGKYPHKVKLPTDAEWKAVDAEVEGLFYADEDDALFARHPHKGVAEE